MCTFKISNYNKKLTVDNFLPLGGPTLTNSYSFNGITFTHNLLSMTGEVTPQPVIQNDILYLLLGEIYNYEPDIFKSDIYFAIEQYKIHKDNFTKYLNGEFLLVVYDMRSEIINFYTDPWSTKLAWFNKLSESDFYFGSFKLNTDSVRLLHNSHYTFNIKNNILEHSNNNLHSWDLNQFKDSYEDWNQAFINSVKRRYHKDSVLALSGGLDSSAIAACLSDLKLPFDSIVLNRQSVEDKDSLRSIISYIKNYCKNVYYIYKDYELLETSKSFEFLSTVNLQYYPLNYVCSKMRYINKKVLYSGHGADEIIDNYIFKFSSRNKPLNMSYWPEDLSTVFPYDNFYDNRQRKLIDMQQYCTLSYGIESRNPFLDKELVQEWLWISSSLKNSDHKGPIKNFLKDRNIILSKSITGLGDQSLQKNLSLDKMLV